EDPGNPTYSTRTIPKIVGGVNPESTAAAAALYALAVERVVPVANARVAEAAKLLENTYRSVNIALVNELKITFERMGIDVWEVIEAAKTKPFGFTAFYPGPGLGGHCIPIDPFYLSWKAAEYGVQARFVELAGEMNRAMPRWVVSKVAEGLNEAEKSVKGSKIVVLGLSYKADIDDDRESPSYEVLDLLREMGADIAYCDPHFPEMPQKRAYDLRLRSVPCNAETLAGFDAVVLCTAHREFKDPALYAGVRLLVDTRHAVAAASPRGPVRLVRA
ncbi:MAG: nucleotide sugar dehydrogenase, partial [Polyangiaceae bacterium]|nr:nucleotide sugar dehydrogenase [Polyangiaceae bacterium]